ncbi:MAG: hypothetical protein HYT79_02245 [Elusimicrobia bacterium]|nr:hypothetical protein [Elusimicrobiota bacterium]
MSKKKDKRAQETVAPAQVPPAKPLWTSGQWKIIAGGILTVAAGFIVLSRADPAGQNWASHLAPFLILGGYAAIGWALWGRRA